jgi:Ca2+-binding EF-hand superfamily protein
MQCIQVLHHLNSLDIQFLAFMKSVTDLNQRQIYKVFDMLDVDGSGLLDFDEFYLLVCILVSVQVRYLPLN